jgi:hypothetical protein
MSPPGYIKPHIFNTMLWQCGCTLMNLVTGVPPFYFDTPEILKEKFINKQPLIDFDRYECEGMSEDAKRLVK